MGYLRFNVATSVLSSPTPPPPKKKPNIKSSCNKRTVNREYLLHILKYYFSYVEAPQFEKMHIKSSKQVRKCASVSGCTKVSCVWKVGGLLHTKLQCVRNILFFFFFFFYPGYTVQYVSVIAWVFDFRKIITITDVSLQAMCLACAPITSLCSQHRLTNERYTKYLIQWDVK